MIVCEIGVHFFRILTGILFLIGSTAQAALVSVKGPNSSLGKAPQIISAPSSVTASGATNKGQQAFNERQGVLLVNELQVDDNNKIDNNGVIAAGTVVDSHFIFFNQKKPRNSNPTNTHIRVKWKFDGVILGIMSDLHGQLEIDSNDLLGVPGTAYPTTTLLGRGLEKPSQGDRYKVLSSNRLRVNMQVTQPGDWIRVITASVSPVPLPAGVWLFGTALFGFVVMSRRRSI